MIWVETPTNPMLKLIDLDGVAALAQQHGVLIVVADNTFASPWSQRPLEYGADLVMHSTTKYLNGHSDMVGGIVVVGENAALRERLGFLQNAVGAIQGRSIHSWRCAGSRRCLADGAPIGTALRIAERLAAHPRISPCVLSRPGLASAARLAPADAPSAASSRSTSGSVEGAPLLERCSCSRWPKASAGSRA